MKKARIMKRSIAMAVLTLIGLTGCSQGTPGGSGVTDTTVKKPIFGQTEDTFTLSVPLMATSLQQGAELETTVGIERAKNFGEDVTLKFAKLPNGVKVTPSAPVIKHSEENVRMVFTAETDAAIGEYTVGISGHPETGKDAEIEFKLNIVAMDTLSLSVPLISTSLKQGESKQVSIDIGRDNTFAGEIALQFGELPAGISMNPAAPAIKQGERTAVVTVSAADDAALGDFTVKITGHPSKGRDTSTELKLSVAQK